MPIQGKFNAKFAKVKQQQTEQIEQIEQPDLVRKNSAILENLNIMYDTLHKETELLRKLKEEPPIFEKKLTLQQNSVLHSSSTSPDADKSARVQEEPKQDEPKKETIRKPLLKTFNKTLKKKQPVVQQARWR
jgi:hypothetical protein